MQTLGTRLVRSFLSALALVLAGCAGTPDTSSTKSRSSRLAQPALPLEVDRSHGNCHIRLDGVLDDITSHSLRSVMAELEKSNCRSKRVLIDQINGQLGSAITIGSIIKNRRYDTQLMPGATCLTPCLLVFAAGNQRIAVASTPPARLGYSQIPRDEDFGRKVCATELSTAQTLTLTRYLRAMLPVETANTVYQKLTAANCLGIDYQTAAQAQAIGLVTATR
ncbi:MAG: hypothetical protein WBI20_01770 [Burkholderiaceae bacterium]